MKILFYLGIVGIILFEIANVYFIMPMPGSQRLHTIDLAFCLYQLRWAFRGIFSVLIFLGMLPALRVSPWISSVLLAFVIGVAYLFNFEMVAEKMFLQPRDLNMADAKTNTLNPEKLVQIIEISEKVLQLSDLEIEVEYQMKDTIGKFSLDFDGTNFLLIAKQTNCLAKDNCGIPAEKIKTKIGEWQEKKSCCTPESNCC